MEQFEIIQFIQIILCILHCCHGGIQNTRRGHCMQCEGLLELYVTYALDSWMDR